jgi:phosphomannomutase
MKTLYMFDVDGTLTPHRQKIRSRFQKFFLEWCEDEKFYLVTGSDLPKTESQVPKEILEKAEGVFTCMGNVLHVDGELIYENVFIPPKQLMNDLDKFLKKSKYILRTGNHVEPRPGMINFSVIGRNATHSQREGYNTYDKRVKEREAITEHINNTYGDIIEASIGGMISIDICPIGNNKGQAFEWIHHKTKEESLHYKFFGDQAKPGGNDWDLIKKMEEMDVSHSFHCVKDDRETFSILKKKDSFLQLI